MVKSFLEMFFEVPDFMPKGHWRYYKDKDREIEEFNPFGSSGGNSEVAQLKEEIKLLKQELKEKKYVSDKRNKEICYQE